MIYRFGRLSLDTARRELRSGETLIQVEPHLTVSEFFRRIPVPVQSMAVAYADALRAAGLPP